MTWQRLHSWCLPHIQDRVTNNHWYPFMSHHIIHQSLDVTPTSLSKVLVLKVWFTLPWVDSKMAKDIQYPWRDFNSHAVTDELIHGASLSNYFKQGVDKLFIILCAIHADYQWISTNEDLCWIYSTRVDCLGVGIYSICSNGFVSLMYVACRDCPMLHILVKT